MAILILVGIIVLAKTYWDYQNEEADTILLLDVWGGWLDISKEEHPTLFQAIVFLQVLIGIGLIIAGFVL